MDFIWKNAVCFLIDTGNPRIFIPMHTPFNRINAYVWNLRILTISCLIAAVVVGVVLVVHRVDSRYYRLAGAHLGDYLAFFNNVI